MRNSSIFLLSFLLTQQAQAVVATPPLNSTAAVTPPNAATAAAKGPVKQVSTPIPANVFRYSDQVEGSYSCSPAEVWGFNQAITESWRQVFLKSLFDSSWNMESVRQLVGLKLLAQSEANVAKNEKQLKAAKLRMAVAEYFIARSWFRLDLHHLAHRAFDSMFVNLSGQNAEGTEGLKLAALECMVRINRIYPGLLPSEAAAGKLHSLIPYAEKKGKAEWIFDLTAPLLMGEILKSGSAEKYSELLKYYRGKSPWQELLGVASAAFKGSNPEMVLAADPIVSRHSLPFSIRPMLDALRLENGRSLIDQNKYVQAFASLKQIKPGSSSYSRALAGKAWVYLNVGKYPEAVSAGNNLLVGKLSRTFSPEAHAVLLMAMNETCNFPEALTALHFFRKSYEFPYHWLAELQSDKDMWGTGRFYRLITDHITGRKRLPARIAFDWLGSSVFISAQAEMNKVFEERAFLKLALLRLPSGQIVSRSSNSRDGRGIASASATLLAGQQREHRQLVNDMLAYLEQHEVKLVERINSDILERSKQMLAELGEVVENVKLVEAEVYSSLGEKVITQDAENSENEATGNKSEKHAGRKLAAQARATSSWDWGSLQSEDLDSAEIWEDEVGFVRTELTDLCIH